MERGFAAKVLLDPATERSDLLILVIQGGNQQVRCFYVYAHGFADDEVIEHWSQRGAADLTVEPVRHRLQVYGRGVHDLAELSQRLLIQVACCDKHVP